MLPNRYTFFKGTLAADGTVLVSFGRLVRAVKIKNATDPRAPASKLHFNFLEAATANDEGLLNREWASYILLVPKVYLLAKNGSCDYEVVVTFGSMD